jgi:hypothetical protein
MRQGKSRHHRRENHPARRRRADSGAGKPNMFSGCGRFPMRKILPVALLTVAFSACTTVQVSPIDPALPLLHVCIKKNPRVLVTDFVQVLEDGFARHGVTTEVFSGKKPGHCEFVLNYTALRSWDISPYLSHAELRITQNYHQVAAATYHLEGKGGLSLMKWEGTKAKMDPVIDQLFAPPPNAK